MTRSDLNPYIYALAVATWIGVYFMLRTVKPAFALYLMRLVTFLGGCFTLIMGVALSLSVKAVGYEPIRGLGFASRDHATWWTVFWLISLTCFALVIVFHVKYRRLNRVGHCEYCGYDLTGNKSGRCPECGETQ